MKPGDTLFRPPHCVRCASCQHVAPLFDPRTHGYDGALGHGSSYAVGSESAEKAALSSTVLEVTVTMLYNIEQAELEKIARETGIRPSDLFDAIDIVCEPVGGGSRLCLSYECA